MESGLRPTATQLDSRLNRFALRFASLSKGTRHENTPERIARSEPVAAFPRMLGQKEETDLLEVASPLEATVTTEQESAAAKQEAIRTNRPGLTMSTDGSPMVQVSRRCAF